MHKGGMIMLLFILLFQIQQLLPSQISGWKIYFSKIDDDVTENDVIVRSGDTIVLEWESPLYALPYEQQPEPFVFSDRIYKEVVLTIRNTNWSSGKVTAEVSTGGMEPGVWQIQVTSFREEAGTVLESKKSDAVRLAILKKQDPPAVPVRVTIKLNP